MKTFLRACLTVCAILGAAASSAPANLITNGDFSTGDFTGWTVTHGGNQSFLSASSNAAKFLSGGSDLDSISQTFVTTPGTFYDLSFSLDVFGSGSGHIPNNAFEVLFNGTVIYSVVNAASLFADPALLNLQATGSSSILEFRGRNDWGGDYLDNIVVTAGAAGSVPETGSTALLMGIALVGLFGVQRFLITRRA